MSTVQVILIGDSDISRWPSDLYPRGTIRNIGKSGATLSDTRRLLSEPDFQAILEQQESSASSITRSVFVVCVGENDLGSGVSLESSAKEMNALLNLLLQDVHSVVLFLGPKLEPWLSTDKAARKSYLQLSLMQERCCKPHSRAHFLDCLTIFCGETAHFPGARMGGRAMPKPQFFDPDQLHLSREGYTIWQQLVNQTMDDVVIPYL